MKKIILSLSLFLIPLGTQAAFIDTLDTYHYFTAIDYLANQEIIEGYADNTYRPETSINRAEFIKIIISSLFDQSTLSANQCFTDTPPELWYTPYACKALDEKIITGYPDGTFGGSNPINLAEALKIIANAYQLDTASPLETETWYTPYLKTMADHNYIPQTLYTLDQPLTRGEMAELIYRTSEDLPDETPSPLTNNTITPCHYLLDSVPTSVDMSSVRQTWLEWNNEVRRDANLPEYTYSSQLHRTANLWSQYMRQSNNMTHNRPGTTAYYDYSAITQWFIDAGLSFANYNRATYSENIGYASYTCTDTDCTAKIISAIRPIFDAYMAEKDLPDGQRGHYDSVMNTQFQKIGLGLATTENLVYLTVHYATKITSDPLPICEDL